MNIGTLLGGLFGVVFVCAIFVIWRWYTSLQDPAFGRIKNWWKEMTLREAQGYLAGLIGISAIIWILGIYAYWIVYLVYYVAPIIMIIGFYQIKIKGRRENDEGRTP
jgi:hypothetical protein